MHFGFSAEQSKNFAKPVTTWTTATPTLQHSINALRLGKTQSERHKQTFCVKRLCLYAHKYACMTLAELLQRNKTALNNERLRPTTHNQDIATASDWVRFAVALRLQHYRSVYNEQTHCNYLETMPFYCFWMGAMRQKRQRYLHRLFFGTRYYTATV